MLSPDEAFKVGGKTANVYEQMEVDMLIEAALQLAQSDLDQAEINRRALKLKNQLDRLVLKYDSDVAHALRADLTSSLGLNAEREGKVARASESQLRTIAADTERRAHSGFVDLRKRLSAQNPTLTSSARKLYVTEAYRAAIQVHTGNRTQRQAIDDAVRAMAQKGLTYDEYTDRSGRTYRVSVDVGVRSAIRGYAMQQMTDQTLRIAEQTGSNLVEVSSHIGARPSHAEWHGKVYMLNGSSPEYENFHDACHPGVPGIGFQGDSNCRHTMGIYREGTSRRWSEDPMAGSSYSNDEAYALKQKQRDYENSIRKLKREKLMLEATGGDASAVNKKIWAKQGDLRNLIADNPEVLHRDRWREQVTKP